MPICDACNNSFPNRIKVDGKYRNLSSRRFCLECSPFGQTNRKDLSNKNRRNGECILCDRASKKARCNTCMSVVYRYRLKLASVKYKGGKCQRCDWVGPVEAFDFHHIDPSTKEFTIGGFSNRSWDILKKELDKCELLCAICHRIHHTKNKNPKLLQAIMDYKGEILDF